MSTYTHRFGHQFFALTSMVNAMTESFSTEWELADLQAFVDRTAEEQGTAAQGFQKSLKVASDNIRWRHSNEQPIIDWLRDYLGNH